MRIVFLYFIITLNIFNILCLAKQKANFLINEESPYLLQHAHNPVLWHPWNEKAFKKAKKQNKLIFISIGYSTCHWCQVMEEESFENKDIAKLLNKDFISIKVDKEQLPHIDTKYQELLFKLKKTNGWPLNFILNANKKLLYISTYIPNKKKYEMQGLDTLLSYYANLDKQEREKILKKIEKKLKDKRYEKTNENKESIEDLYTKKMIVNYDLVNQGFFTYPKFPLAKNINLLYEIALLKKDEKLLKIVEKTLEKIALSATFDQIEGGFFRYSVTNNWNTPHFEKMLYTQAELIPLYYKMYLRTSKAIFKESIEKSIDMVNKTFKNKDELFYSAINASSKNYENKKEEGFYYTYNYDEVLKELEKKEIINSEEILEYLGFEEFGNFKKEQNIVSLKNDKRPKKLKEVIKILKKIKNTKQKPFVDEKIITSWNALMIKALFISSNINKKYLIQGETSLNSLIQNLYINNILYHQKYKKKPTQKALLEDYSFLIDLLLTAYQTTYEKRYLDLANSLNQESLNKFYKNKKWYFDEEKLFEASFNDKYYASALATLFHNNLSLANLNYSLEDLAKTKNLILEQKDKILSKPLLYPESIRALIKIKNKNVILKSNKQDLKNAQKQIQKIKYPYILRTIEDTNLYLACDEKSCFAYNHKINEIIKVIDK